MGDVAPLSPEALYEVLGQDPKGFYCKIKEAFSRDQVEEVAMRHLDDSDAAFDKNTFESFCENLAFDFGMDESLLVEACRFAKEGKFIMTPDIIKLIFLAVPKAYKVGQKFHKSDFLQVCGRCKWVNKKFTEKDAQKVFEQVMKKHPKKHPGAPVKRVNIGGHTDLVSRNKADEYIISVTSFENLFELLADKKHMSALKLLADLQVVGKDAAIRAEFGV